MSESKKKKQAVMSDFFGPTPKKPKVAGATTSSSASKPKPKISVANTKVSSSKPKVTPSPKAANGLASGWGFLNGDVNAVLKKQREKNKRKAPAEGGQDNITGRKIVKEAYTAGDHLPIITEPEKMFDDMVRNQLCENSSLTDILVPLLQSMHGKSLTIATMCSGTESPILALDMIRDSILRVCQEYQIKVEDKDGNLVDPTFELDHLFSCEIEPHKQCYLQRNFQPKVLFRDVQDLGNDKAPTAFGSLVDVPNTPGCCDVLVAGTSCVDFSGLNNKKKSLDDKGESGATFLGMMTWIKKARPLIVILENVVGAEWDKFVEHLESVDYAAVYDKSLDTKQYYIPHTRNRGYLFAISRSGREKVDRGRLKRWKDTMKKLERPASAAIDAFMLSNDDPILLRAKQKLVTESAGDGNASKAGRTDWTRCETRHQFARENEELGDRRPLTVWSDSGTTVMPAFAWNEWMGVQVNRVTDLTDINTLRLAKFDLDLSHKTLIMNLSQNCDRETISKLGITSCLTPSGIPYLTNRGGPLIAHELLSLQGIPARDLILTKQSEDQLKDMAGNAMTTTVVGACILSALLSGHQALETNHSMPARSLPHALTSLVPRPLVPKSKAAITQACGSYKQGEMALGQSEQMDKTTIFQLLARGRRSARLCFSEGADQSKDDILLCSECGQTVSVDCATPVRPFEEHCFQPATNILRVDPPAFRKELLRAIPLVVEIRGVDVDSLIKPSEVSDKLWANWKEKVKACCDVTYRFARLDRKVFWQANFAGPCGESRLELRVYEKSAEWLLFAEAPLQAGKLRDVLKLPVARFTVLPSAGSFVLGKFEILLPVLEKVNITIEATGTALPSWRQRLGLKGPFETESAFEKVKVSISTPDHDLKKRIDGVYSHKPKCGCACGSLHRKDDDTSPLFFFLESGRVSLPKDDSFVFANSCHRTSYGEFREVLLTVDPSYRHVFPNGQPTEEDRVRTHTATLPGKWTVLEKAQIRDLNMRVPITVPNSLSVSLPPCGWREAVELVSISVPLDESLDVIKQCQQAENALEVNQQKSKSVLESFAFVLARLSIPRIATGGWIEIENTQVDIVADNDCAPPPPSVKWTVVSVGNKTKYIPVEDAKEASNWEAKLKSRPTPWIIRLASSGGNSVNIQIGCNIFSLVHRALGLFPRKSPARNTCIVLNKHSGIDSRCRFDWKVVDHFEKGTADFPKLRLRSNKLDAESQDPPHFHKFTLRKEQRRSVSWMISQELSSNPFLEEEVCEDLLQYPHWRLEARARRPVSVFGGIICDEVGYGKTAISLALIDMQTKDRGEHLPPDQSKLLPTKATLVVVPSHLVGQWPSEIQKFLGSSKNVVVLKDMTSFNHTTVRAIQQADIVIVNFKILCGSTYFERLARLTGRNPKSFPSGEKGGRHFNDVYHSCRERVAVRSEMLQNDVDDLYGEIKSDAAQCAETEANSEVVKTEGKKAQYKQRDMAKKSLMQSTAQKEKDPWGLTSKAVRDDWQNMTCPPLELFQWRRIITDEFTYLLDKAERQRPLTVVTNLSSQYRWYLSGTPATSNFTDVAALANLLGIHLGVDELLPGTKINRKHLEDKSGAENLAQLMEVRSPQWHERRHKQAQVFLDRFVRQNCAEIDEIPAEEKVKFVPMPPVERAIYLELDTYLRSLDMNSQAAKKSKKKSSSDREKRMQKILQDSGSAEEALLKCCTCFHISDDDHASSFRTLETIIDRRKTELKDLRTDIIQSVAAALRQQNRIEKKQPGWKSVKRSEKGEIVDPVGIYLSDVSNCKSISHGADEEVHKLLQKLVIRAQAVTQADPNKRDPVFAAANGDGEVEEDVDGERSDGENERHPSSQKKRKLSQTDKKVNKKEDEKSEAEILFGMKKALRDHCHVVRSLGKELAGRVRSLRFIEEIRRLQGHQESGLQQCRECNSKSSKQGILSVCGHSGCLFCLKSHASQGRCLHPHCAAQVGPAHVIPVDALGKSGKDEKNLSHQEGAKLGEILVKVKEILSSTDDGRILIFCQWDSLISKVINVLGRNGVKALQVKGSVERQVKALEPFQKEKPAFGDPRVLVLKLDDEQSSGLNLTKINHVIFAHCLLAESKNVFEAYETQAIGRVRRYGQSKTVYVWRYLVEDSIDSELYDKFGSQLFQPLSNSQ